MKTLLHLPGAVYELVRLAFVTRFSFKGPYWSWRLNTAFGRGYPPRRELLAELFAYARWIRSMRRGL